MGIVITTRPIIVSGIFILYLDLNTVIPTINVLSWSFWRKIRAIISSFHTHKEFTTIKVIIGGIERGSIILVRVLKEEHPSIKALSMIA